LILFIILQGTNLPFTRKVVELALPLKFRVPQIDLYNKTKDPSDHIETYRAYMTQ
jgi:predicted ATP-grasp superfamily ATP-dependent carboligase